MTRTRVYTHTRTLPSVYVEHMCKASLQLWTTSDMTRTCTAQVHACGIPCAPADEGSTYGQARGGGAAAEVSERLESIRQNVESLVALEWQAQTSFLSLKSRWSGGAHGTAAAAGGATPMEA